MKRIVPASSLFAAQRAAGGSPPSDVPPTNIAVPTVSGTAQVGSVLTATTGTWAGTSPITYAYQWQRGTTPVAGATNATYTVVSGDLGNTLRVVVTATNVAGSASANSANTGTVVNPPASPVNTVAPAVSGTAAQGFQLTVSNGTWTGDTPITYTYQWVRGASDIAGATAATYTLVSADVGQQIRCRVTATNAAGNASANSNQTGAVAAAAITINTPVSPQPPASPVVVSGTYVGNMTTASTLVWRNGGVNVGSPITIPTVSGGNWTATITSPAAGTYTLLATHNLGPTTTSSNVTVEANAATTVANFTFDGSGDGEGTIAIFGHSFPEGAIPAGSNVMLRRSDNNAALRTTFVPLTAWPDGSAKTAEFAGELPALADGTLLQVGCRVGEAHPDPGLDLTWSSALSGRSITIRTWAPGDTVTPLWTYDVAAALLASSDDWMTGPLAITRRVVTQLPGTATFTTSDTQPGPPTVRLLVDVTATKDGMLLADWCFANDRVHVAGGGPARFGYTVEIDGEIVHDSRPATGAGRDLLQYNWWWRRRAKKGEKVYNFGTVFRPLFRPDYDVLVESAFLLPYETSLWPADWATTGFADVADGVPANSTNPYWSAGLARRQADVGGRPEIGYKTGPQAAWAVMPSAGRRRAELVAHIQAEAFGTAGVYTRDYEFDRPVLVDEWPNFVFSSWSGGEAIKTRADAQILPSNQFRQNNSTDHIDPDQSHRGAHFGLTSLLSGRRLMYDALAFRAAEVPVFLNRFFGTNLGDNGGAYRNFTPDHTTGLNWAQGAHATTTRALAWQLRDIVEAAYLIPSGFQRADFYRKNAAAYFNMLVRSQPLIDARYQNYFGLVVTLDQGWRVSNFMYSFLFYAIAAARRAGIEPGLAGTILDRMTDFRAGGAQQSDALARNMRVANDVDWAPSEQGPPFPATTWAQVETMRAMPTATWSSGVTEIDWQRNAINSIMLAAEYAGSAEKRGLARDALVRFWSERKQPNNNPVSGPADWTGAANPQTNHLRPSSFGYDWNTSPVLATPASLSADIDVPAGTFLGLVEWAGAIPRCTTAANANNDAFEFVSPPSPNPLTISRGGIVRRSNVGTLSPGNNTFQVRCRTISGSAARGETEITYWSAPVTVTVNAIAELPVLSANQNVSIPQNAAVGSRVALFTYTGTTATSAALTGDTTNNFSVHLLPNREVEIRVATTLPTGPTSRTLGLTVTNVVGTSVARTAQVAITGPVTPPDIEPESATFNITDNAASGAVVGTLAAIGTEPLTWTIQSGNDLGRFSVVRTGDGAAELRAATSLAGAVGTYNLGIRATNPGGFDDVTRTVEVTAATVSTIWDATAPSATFLWLSDVDDRLVPGFSGPHLRLRRNSDNATQEFNLTAGGRLDRAAISAWAPSQIVWVERIYDQAGGPHLEQTNTAWQFQLTDATGAFFQNGTNGRAYIANPSNQAFMVTGTINIRGPQNRYAMLVNHRRTNNRMRTYLRHPGTEGDFMWVRAWEGPNSAERGAQRSFQAGASIITADATAPYVLAARVATSTATRAYANASTATGGTSNATPFMQAAGYDARLVLNGLALDAPDGTFSASGQQYGGVAIAHTISDTDIEAVISEIRTRYGI